jgi:hypothetical protein
MSLLQAAYVLFTHPLRDIGTVALIVALLLAAAFWPGWTEAKWRTVTVCCFLYALPLWAWLNARAAWGRFNRAIGRRP